MILDFNNRNVKELEVINGYLYYAENTDDNNNDVYKYYRMKIDGTGLEKQNKPFEWYY